MKANELMIGDWVNYKGIYSQIASADFDYNRREWIKEIEPIPLTEEILEENGFVNKDNEWVHCCDFPFIDFTLNKDSKKYNIKWWQFVDELAPSGLIGFNGNKPYGCEEHEITRELWDAIGNNDLELQYKLILEITGDEKE